jgi:hypothetical protein
MAYDVDRAYEDTGRPIPERQLWAAVLHQALDDALNGVSSGPSDWIGSRDFAEVAELAGLDPSAARAGFARRLNQASAATLKSNRPAA